MLLIYSLLPGIAKIYDNTNIMIFNVFIILYFVLSSRMVIIRKDLLYLSLIIFICIQSIVAFVYFPINKLGLFMGIYMFFIPMLGYLLARDKYRNKLNIIYYIRNVAIVHSVIGILLYPLFPFHKLYYSLFLTLNENVMAARMASVSGSLGFGILMNVGLSIQIFRVYIEKKRSLKEMLILGLFISTTFLSLQRSAWLAAVFNILFIVFLELKKGKIGMLLKIVYGGSALIAITLLNLSSEVIVSRITTFDISAVMERSDMWIGAIENFVRFPSGIGLGQVGQVARFAPNNNVNGVTDGDYFRILSELGLIGMVVVIVYLVYHLYAMVKCKKDSFVTLTILILNSFFIAMIGSNATEFYFVNFIFWYILGIFIRELRINVRR